MSWLPVAAASGVLAVAAGAFGAHGLKARVTPELLSAWETASLYHLLHSLALLALALYAQASGVSVRWPAGLFAAGILLFSGSIYGLVLTDLRWLGPVTPLGGLCLMAGWASLFWLASD